MEKTLDIQLQELREQIAQDIESTMLADAKDVPDEWTFYTWNNSVAQCASIARGQHK